MPWVPARTTTRGQPSRSRLVPLRARWRSVTLRGFALEPASLPCARRSCDATEERATRALGPVAASPRERSGLLNHAQTNDFCNCIRRTDAPTNGPSSRPRRGLPTASFPARQACARRRGEASHASPTGSKTGRPFLANGPRRSERAGEPSRRPQVPPRSALESAIPAPAFAEASRVRVAVLQSLPLSLSEHLIVAGAVSDPELEFPSESVMRSGLPRSSPTFPPHRPTPDAPSSAESYRPPTVRLPREGRRLLDSRGAFHRLESTRTGIAPSAFVDRSFGHAGALFIGSPSPGREVETPLRLEEATPFSPYAPARLRLRQAVPPLGGPLAERRAGDPSWISSRVPKRHRTARSSRAGPRRELALLPLPTTSPELGYPAPRLGRPQRPKTASTIASVHGTDVPRTSRGVMHPPIRTRNNKTTYQCTFFLHGHAHQLFTSFPQRVDNLFS